MSPRSNLLSLLGEFERYAKDVAVIERRGYRREKWTYGKISQNAARCALELKKRGVSSGERVLLWGPNSAEWLIAFWGCLLRGAIVVPMDAGATAEFAFRVSRDAGVVLAFASRAMAISGLTVPTINLEDLPDTLSVTPSPRSLLAQSKSPNLTGTDFSDQPITRSQIAEILYTSGTTAEPRGVVLTHGNFLSNLEPLEKGITPYRKFERWFHPLRLVSLVPLSHVFGQFMALFAAPLFGATMVFELSPNPAEFVRTIKRERATALIAVPRLLDALAFEIQRSQDQTNLRRRFDARYQKAKNRKFLRRAWIFRTLHFQFGWNFWAFISGGAALCPDTELFFKRLGYAVVQGYGMTETASLISLNHPFRAAEGSVGKILPGRQFKLAEDGEILVRGENVSPGYWENGSIKPSSSVPRSQEKYHCHFRWPQHSSGRP
jgi:long-chain acyl-CoA synthetase